MNAARIRLIVAAVLVAGWFGYLAYLALAKEPPVIVPRPQLLAATHIVKAKLVDLNSPVREYEVLRGSNPGGPIQIDGLKDARSPGNKPAIPDSEYLLLLDEIGPGRFRFLQPQTPTVYLWTPDVERQARVHQSR